MENVLQGHIFQIVFVSQSIEKDIENKYICVIAK